jgi:hypothetical protein
MLGVRTSTFGSIMETPSKGMLTDRMRYPSEIGLNLPSSIKGSPLKTDRYSSSKKLSRNSCKVERYMIYYIASLASPRGITANSSVKNLITEYRKESNQILKKFTE